MTIDTIDITDARRRLPPALARDLSSPLTDPMTTEQEAAAFLDLRGLRVACWRAALSHPRFEEILPPWLSSLALEGRVGLSSAHHAAEANRIRRRAPLANRDHQRAVQAATGAFAEVLLNKDVDPDAPAADRHDRGLVLAAEAVRRLAKVDRSCTAWARTVADTMRARATLIATIERRNLRMVVAVAKKFLAHHSAQTMSLADLVAEGMPGLRHAVFVFDPSRGLKFSTSAMWWIRHAVGRAVVDRGRLVRLPSHVQERITKVQQARRRLATEGSPCDDATIAAVTKMSVAAVRKAAETLVTFSGVTSLDAPRYSYDHEEAAPAHNFVEDDSPGADESIEAQQRHALVARLLGELSDRERVVIMARVGLSADGGEVAPRVLREIGPEIGVTRERVRQIERAALLNMRAAAERAGFTREAVL
jgi:RNA polymerase sigma factor (sigma-70 family)